jgi:pimeloyl-ACP methyl ester carboxylesterase
MSVLVQRARWSFVASFAALAAAGCVPDTRESAATDSERSTSTIAAAPALAPEDFAAAADRDGAGIAFTPCPEDATVECGQLSVPINYAQPRGQRISIAVARAPALSSAKKGVLFLNPGGPGASGVDFLLRAVPAFATLRQSFDLISFDPRGVARSRSLDCTLELPASPSDGSVEANAVFLDEFGARYQRACNEQFGDLATQIGTANVARDMDAIRAALGEREMNYLGFSYGTVLGASYATLFPQRVRAMVLDANASPAWFSDYLLELDADGSAGAELALKRLDQLCRASASCPLRTAGVVATFDRLVEQLNNHPVVIGDAVISGLSITYSVFPLLYQERFGWAAIPSLLARVDAGDLSQLPAFPTGSSSTITVPSVFAIICDDSTSRRLGLDYLPAQFGNNALYSRFGGINFGIGISLCSQWPQQAATPLANLRTRQPVVLLGNDFDPATPMVWSRNMATALGDRARLVRYRGGGHTIYRSGSACVDGAVESYLRDLTPPAKGLTCPAVPISFAPAAARLASDASSDASIAEILAELSPKPAPPLRGR